MSTRVSVNTYAHSATYVTDQLLNSLKRIVIWIGLDTEKFMDNWGSTELAISTWLKSKHLEKITLEVYDPRTDDLKTRWDFAIDYQGGSDGDGTMWADTDAIRHAIVKCGVIPSQCSYRVLLTNKDGHPDVAGWSSTIFRSTAGLTRQSVGTTIGAGSIAASGGYWRSS